MWVLETEETLEFLPILILGYYVQTAILNYISLIDLMNQIRLLDFVSLPNTGVK